MKQLFFPAFFLIGCSEKYADFSILDASRENNLYAVIQHLNNCADVNQKDRYIGYTPLHYSAWNGNIDIAELLIVKGANLIRNEYGNPLFADFFFFITGFHGFHVFSGVVINIIIFINVLLGTYERRGHYDMVEKVGLYWHFVDLVWVFVFTFFYLV